MTSPVSNSRPAGPSPIIRRAPRCGFVFLAQLIALTAVSTLAGCGGGGGGGSSTPPAAVIALEIFTEHNGFSGNESYAWETPTTVGRIQFRVRGFHQGNVRVRVSDASGTEVYNKIYWHWDDYYIVGHDEFLDIDFSASGSPGMWALTLEYAGFSGHLDLALQETTDGNDVAVEEATQGSLALDGTFGFGGRVTYTPFRAYGVDSTLDALNRLVVTGSVIDDAGRRRLAAWRITAGGSLDSSFGSGGFALFDTGMASAGRGIAIDGGGDIWITGWIESSPDNLDAVVVRLRLDGLVDTSFAGAGFVTYDDSGLDDIGSAIAIDSFGRVVVGGNTRNFSTNTGNVFCLRYISNGAPDVVFGTNGVAVSTDPTDRCEDMVLDNDRPTLVGERVSDLAIWRLTTDGDFDGTFGTAGYVGGGSPPGEERRGLGLSIRAADGAIAVAGLRIVGSGDVDLGAWRFTTSGTPDSSFGTNGFVPFTFSGGESVGSDIVFEPGGSVLLVGITRTSALLEDNDTTATLWRFNTNGALMDTPGTTGVDPFDQRSTANVTTAAFDLQEAGGGAYYAVGSAGDAITGSADLMVWRLVL